MDHQNKIEQTPEQLKYFGIAINKKYYQGMALCYTQPLHWQLQYHTGHCPRPHL